MTNSIIQGFKTFCLGGHSHQTLRGRSSFHRKSWNLVAQPYPQGVCRALARALAASSGFAERRAFDPASCARCSHARIGEAGHHGPPKSRRDVLLEEVPLVEAKTAALQSRFWSWFMRWLNEHLSADAVKNLVENPLLLCYLLKEFGNHLFSTGKSLHVFRHLVVFTQKHFLETRQFMSISWDMIARWERLEPPVHRTPTPAA